MGIVSHGLQGAENFPLLLGGAILDKGHRGFSRQPMLDQLTADVRGMGQAHVEHQRAARVAGQLLPVSIRCIIAALRRDKGDAVSIVTVGKRNPRLGSTTGRGGNAGNDLHCDTGLPQAYHFFTAAAEGERVAALEPDHALAGTGRINGDLFDLVLWHGVIAGLLADVDLSRPPWHQCQNLCRHQPVVNHYLGLFQRPARLDGQQFRITGPGAYQQHRRGSGLAPEQQALTNTLQVHGASLAALWWRSISAVISGMHEPQLVPAPQARPTPATSRCPAWITPITACSRT